LIGGWYEVIYYGERLPSGRRRVTRYWRDDDGDLHAQPLNMRPGYDGSGEDLARSLLWDAIYREPEPELYQTFRREVCDRLAERGWMLNQKTVQTWVQDVLARRGVQL
jgi:hypothetical protein